MDLLLKMLSMISFHLPAFSNFIKLRSISPHQTTCYYEFLHLFAIPSHRSYSLYHLTTTSSSIAVKLIPVIKQPIALLMVLAPKNTSSFKLVSHYSTSYPDLIPQSQYQPHHPHLSISPPTLQSQDFTVPLPLPFQFSIPVFHLIASFTSHSQFFTFSYTPLGLHSLSSLSR